MKKRALALILSVMMVLVLCPAVCAADAPTTGKCGDNLTWRLVNDTLYIEGIGDMYNYLSGEKGDVGIAPWKESNTSSIAHIQVAPGVTSIGDYAFDNLTNLLDASLPEGITRIGDSAFDFCYNATDILLPTTITSIGESAFHLCMVLENLKIPAGMTEIGQYAFSFCENLTSITIPEGISSINDGTFNGCYSLVEVILPQSLKSIGFAAFEDCRNIVSIKIPNNVTIIDHSAFWGCQRLKSVSIPIGVTDLSYTFTDCRSLSDVYYGGSEAQWEQIKRLSSDSYLENATIHFNSKMPESVPKPSTSFTDVPADAFYADAVEWAVENDVTSGTGGGKFSPDDDCTRAQIVTFLWRAYNRPEPESTVSPFADVTDPDAYYYKAVLWAAENDITSGTDDTHFSPETICTRGQAMTFQWRAADKPAASGGSSFTDVPGDAFYAGAVGWAVENYITSGTGGGKFSPDDTCTRAQIVTFLFRELGE